MRYLPLPAMALLWALIGVSGCVTPAKKPALESTAAAPERIADKFLAQARDLEAQGFPVRALRACRIALTVDASNQEALQTAERLESSLAARSEAHYRKGMELQKQGKYGLARREFLVALRLKPDHAQAAQALVARKRVRTTRYVVHRIQSGESLSRIAQRYYGDYRKFPEIARYNHLTDATRVMVGQELKIPEIEGVPFHTGEVQVQMEEKGGPETGFWEWGRLDAVQGAVEPPAETHEEARVQACRANGIARLKEKNYARAIEAFERVLEADPNDEAARDFLFRARFQQAESLLEKQDYLAAREGFLASLRIREDCGQCHQYVRKSEELYKEAHYRKGMQFYNQERLQDAIREWDLVRELDPGYKRVEYLIEKAEKILSKLEDLKKDRQNTP